MTRCNYDFNSSTDSQFTENEDDLDDITFLEVSKIFNNLKQRTCYNIRVRRPNV